MIEIFNSPIFGVMAAIFLYLGFDYIYRKTKFILINPLFITSAIFMIFIKISKIEPDIFIANLSSIGLFVGPLIVALAVPVAQHFQIIKKNIIPISLGVIFGSLTAIFSIKLIGPLFGLDSEIINSIIPKSVTSPIAVEISTRLGGIKGLTVTAVLTTAIIGTVFWPKLAKLLKLDDPLILGISLGTTSHAVGTTKALEIDPLAGAMSSVALTLAGVFTTLVSFLL